MAEVELAKIVEVRPLGEGVEGLTVIGQALWALVELTLVLTVVSVILPIALAISGLVSSSTLGTIVQQFNNAITNAGGENTTAGQQIANIESYTINGLSQEAQAMSATLVTVAQITEIVALISMFLIILAELMNVVAPVAAARAF
jgi:hypothetical protein